MERESEVVLAIFIVSFEHVKINKRKMYFKDINAQFFVMAVNIENHPHNFQVAIKRTRITHTHTHTYIHTHTHTYHTHCITRLFFFVLLNVLAVKKADR